ncbi:hypothetical protein A2U01_0053647 [Trifolium medium]|uniref:Uncharacterized protein n=1 Tax=Trifolium medium TaxID=97028 RepID=A0A392R757_9FABA|nr:hypothetical protein [Trifolium medium]
MVVVKNHPWSSKAKMVPNSLSKLATNFCLDEVLVLTPTTTLFLVVTFHSNSMSPIQSLLGFHFKSSEETPFGF